MFFRKTNKGSEHTNVLFNPSLEKQLGERQESDLDQR